MYADRNFYLNDYKGAILPPESFDNFNRKASVFIDYITFNRLKNIETIPEEVKFATCYVMEQMYEYTNGTGINPTQIKSSERIGDYQVAYEPSRSESQIYYDAAKEYLAHTGLLYRGL